MASKKKSIWVFGDYRNYYQNRVTLQLISKAMDLAKSINAEVCALVFGHEIDEWIMEYTAHGADRILAIDDPALKSYSTEQYLAIMENLARERDPEIILIGATDFGREFAPRLAKRLKTGLSADCVGLEITAEGLLVQIAPSFGGNMLAEIVTENHRPQMATVLARVRRELVERAVPQHRDGGPIHGEVADAGHVPAGRPELARARAVVAHRSLGVPGRAPGA